jgi:hypothetical protein
MVVWEWGAATEAEEQTSKNKRCCMRATLRAILLFPYHPLLGPADPQTPAPLWLPCFHMLPHLISFQVTTFSPGE